jgi:hypothetical protein
MSPSTAVSHAIIFNGTSSGSGVSDPDQDESRLARVVIGRSARDGMPAPSITITLQRS